MNDRFSGRFGILPMSVVILYLLFLGNQFAGKLTKHPLVVDAGSPACVTPCCDCAKACFPNPVVKCGAAEGNSYCTCSGW